LGKHDGIRGKWYREAWAALSAELGPMTGLRRLEAGRVCVAWVNLRASTQALEDARRGRAPKTRQIARLARRQGLDDATYGQALGQLRALVGAKKAAPTPADLVARLRAGGGR
jgi:hypothetical protein